MNNFQEKVNDVMESIDESNSFNCETRSDLKKVAKALVETNGYYTRF